PAAASSHIEPRGQPEVWVMKADGSGRHRLTRDGGFPAWSPGGSMIAYAPGGGASGRSRTAGMNADGSGQRRVPRTDWGEYPSWSPGGKRIALNSNLSGGPLRDISTSTVRGSWICRGRGRAGRWPGRPTAARSCLLRVEIIRAT